MPPTKPDLKKIEETLRAAVERKTYRRMDFFEPYEKQKQFFELGATKRERLLMAGNQLGKTEAGAAEATYHLTGEYPADWKGRRFTKPVRGWIAGETAMLVRDVQQKKLCGQPGVESAIGTGFIPKAAFADKPTLARGVSDAFDTIQVKHVSGGISTATFKSYEQGRPKFQGEPVDFVWLDEEPGIDLYSESLTRTTATRGMVYMTFTPLKGMSEVVMRFLNEPSEDRAYVTMTIEDALHIPPEEREKIIAGYPAHEREARAKGIPLLGSGRIFQISEESITEPQLQYIPPTWRKLWGIDFGINHAFAGALIAWDVDNDTIHLLHTVRMKDQLPIQHAAAMKTMGASVPVAWPHDGHVRDKGSGEPLSTAYRKHGLQMLGVHSTWPDGSLSTEAAILELQERMTTNRFKAASHLSDFFEEFRMYHRKDGQIVKERDDILSAVFKTLMMKRFAKPVPLGSTQRKRPGQLAEGVEFDVFA